MSSKRGLKGHILWNTHKIWNYDKNIHVIEYYPKFGLQHPHIDCALVIILYSNNLQWQQWEHSKEGNQTILVQHNSSYLSLKHDTQDPVLPLDLILVYWHCLNFFFRLVKTAQYLICHLYGGQVTIYGSWIFITAALNSSMKCCVCNRLDSNILDVDDYVEHNV